MKTTRIYYIGVLTLLLSSTSSIASKQNQDIECQNQVKQHGGLGDATWMHSLLNFFYFSKNSKLKKDVTGEILLQTARLCSISKKEGTGNGLCDSVDLNNECVTINDIRDGGPHMLMIPSVKISGIDDAALLKKNSPNFWQCAWADRANLGKLVHKKLDRNEIVLAINSQKTRSADQLHIHMGCVYSSMQKILKKNENIISNNWIQLKHFRVRKIAGNSLIGVDPFKLLNENLKDAAGNPDTMGSHALVVIGETFSDGSPGFYLIDRNYVPGSKNFPYGESDLDPQCKIAE